MNKKDIIEKLTNTVNNELIKVKQAYETTKNLVQAGDLKSDGKYDTRATEANYLADGQRQRITELEQELQLLEEIPTGKLKNNAEISIGALVDIELNSNTRTYFISPTAGGTLLDMNGTPVLVLSVFSPIGAEAIGLSVGDEFELELKGDTRVYTVKSIR